MSDPARDKALKDLASRAAALETSTAKAPAQDFGGQAVGQAYRIIAELLGGVLVGLALGAGVDWLAGTRPWGLIGGVLLGFAASLVMAGTTARRLQRQAVREHGIGRDLPADDEEE
jgi:ATP synthase protein I